MKEITILSGKGGTGKTTITAALASVASNSVLADSDVDAADMHLILHPEIKERHNFKSGWVASIDVDTCTDCQLCTTHCRFDAIHYNAQKELYINPYQCEGCRLCERICPAKAIHSVQKDNNHWFVSSTRFGTLVHAEMAPGEENSGKLVTQVRKIAHEIAQRSKADFILNDGPPGLGCSAISSLTGTDLVLLVLEPSRSALQDAERLLDLIHSFELPVYAILNKWDISPEQAEEIENFLRRHKVPLLAKLPFGESVVKAMIEGKTIVEYQPDSMQAKQIKSIWEQIRLLQN